MSVRKTPSVLFAAVLLGGALIGAAPAASAKTPMKTFSMAFAYNATDPAHKIYADLQDTARKACRENMSMTYHAVSTLRGCTRSMVEAALKAMTRTDVALLHDNRNA